MTHGDGGKGSGRRQEDVSKINENWDIIFGRKSAEKEKLMIDEQEYHLVEEEEWTCDVCGGPMYSAAHWTYGQCDDCGARQELESDF